jgi:hypothetical protein
LQFEAKQNIMEAWKKRRNRKGPGHIARSLLINFLAASKITSSLRTKLSTHEP